MSSVQKNQRDTETFAQGEENDSAHKMRRNRRPTVMEQTGKKRLVQAPLSGLSIGLGVAAVLSVLTLTFSPELPNFVLSICLLGLSLAALVYAKMGSKVSALQQNQVTSPSNELAERLEALEDQAWEIRESEEIHRSLLEAFGDVVLHRNPQGAITFNNQHFTRYFENTACLPQHQDTHGKALELELETRMGPRWFNWIDLPVRDSETGQTGVRSIARDITERKLQEEALVKARQRAEVANEAKSRFLAMISHEIRTPLNGVLGMAQLLQRSQLDATQSSHVEAITKSGHLLLGLIEDLLDTAQVEAGQLKLEPSPTDLAGLVEDVAEILGPRASDPASGKGLLLATYIDPRIPQKVSVDAGRLRQVLINLAGNAVKFTERGGVGIFVRLKDQALLSPDTIEVVFDVRDSGPGLSEEDQCKIFDEFVQSDNSATRAHGGAGLGLAISKRLVALMGGELMVSSKEGDGACFSFNLPLTTDHPVSTGSTEHLLGKHIALLGECSPGFDALQKTLEQEAGKVSVLQEVQAVPKTVDDIILSHQDVASSRSSLGVLRQSGPKQPNIYLLADDHHRNDMKTLVAEGFDGWLIRPVRKSSLLDVLCQTKTVDVPMTAQPAVNASTASLNILLAEDNEINAMLVTALLKRLGHTVHHVENGEAACAAFKAQKFGLILMDLHMPVMGGLEAIEAIRGDEQNEETARVPIIVLSAEGLKDVRDKAQMAGADAFALKPLDIDTFEAQLSELFPNSEIQPAH